MIKGFRSLITWQKSRDRSVNIYRNFSSVKDFGFRDQIQRASVSVMNNIAEGFDRRSNKELNNIYISQRVRAVRFAQ